MTTFSKVTAIQNKPKSSRTDEELLDAQKDAFGIFLYAGKVYAAFSTMPQVTWLDITRIVLPNKIFFAPCNLIGNIIRIPQQILEDELLSSSFFLALRNLAELDSETARLLILAHVQDWEKKFLITESKHDGYSTFRFQRYSDQEVFQIHLTL